MLVSSGRVAGGRDRFFWWELRVRVQHFVFMPTAVLGFEQMDIVRHRIFFGSRWISYSRIYSSTPYFYSY